MKHFPISGSAQRWIDFFAIVGPWLSWLIMFVGTFNQMIVCGPGAQVHLMWVWIISLWLAVPGLLLGVMCSRLMEWLLGWGGFAWIALNGLLGIKHMYT